MNMKKLKYILIIALMAGSVFTYGQAGEMQLNLGVSGALPMGDSKDILPDASIRGWQVGVLYGFNDKISAGLQVGFQDFYNKTERRVYQTENGHISAVLSHSLQTVPILLGGRYSFTPEASVRPFAGIGIGGNIVTFAEYLGQFGGSNTKVKFAARPEVGLAVPFGRFKDNAFWLSAAYNYMPYNEFDIKNINHGTVALGITLPMRR